MAKNVWIDDAYEYSGQTLHYCVKMNGTKIYDGIATADDFPIKIYLNRIAQGYLQSTFPLNGFSYPDGDPMIDRIEAVGSAITEDTGASAVFTLVEKTFNGADWVEGNVLYRCYYIDAWGGENGQEMAKPINGRADFRQMLFFTSNIEYDDPNTGSTPDTGDTPYTGSSSDSNCRWVKVTPRPAWVSSYVGAGPNYYTTVNGVQYWVFGRRRLKQDGPGYPDVYKYECE